MEEIEIFGFRTLIPNDTYARSADKIYRRDTGISVPGDEIIQIDRIKVPASDEIIGLIIERVRGIVDGNGKNPLGKFIKNNLSKTELEKIVGEDEATIALLTACFPFVQHEIGADYLRIAHGTIPYETLYKYDIDEADSKTYAALIQEDGLGEWYSSLRLESGLRFPDKETISRIFRNKTQSSAEFMVEMENSSLYPMIELIGRRVYNSISNGQIQLLYDASRGFASRIARGTIKGYILNRDNALIDLPESAEKKDDSLKIPKNPFSEN